MSLIDLDCDNIPKGGGGGTSLNKPYRFVPHQKVCFLCCYGLKTAKILPILVWNRVWLSREVQEFMNVFVVSNPNEKETERADANSKWILRIFLLAF